jgi:hypothetical protein
VPGIAEREAAAEAFAAVSEAASSPLAANVARNP